MGFTLEDLLPADQQLRTVQPHEPVDCAINIMYQHGYSQLPVTGANGKFQGQVITFESILRAIRCFRTEAEALLVRDAAQRVRSYAADADLLATLDDIHRENFALIVDDLATRAVRASPLWGLRADSQVALLGSTSVNAPGTANKGDPSRTQTTIPAFDSK